ncbi:MAG: hypothetical protein Q9174_006082, partial [Haloplaca sp. 1 TL-2023]
MAGGLLAFLFLSSYLLPVARTQALQLENLSSDLGYNSSLLARLANKATPSDSNLTIASNVTDNGFIYCNGDRYRRGLDYASCTDAVYQIPSSPTIRRFQNRQFGGAYDVAVPTRFIGCTYAFEIDRVKPVMKRSDVSLDNGRCIVEIVLKDDVAEAEASYYDVASSARELLHSCAQVRREGGIATDI